VRSPRSVGLPSAERTRVAPAAFKRVARAVAARKRDKLKLSTLVDPHAAIRELAERKYKRGEGVTKARPGREASREAPDILALLRESLAKNDLGAKATRGGARRVYKKKTAGRR
jgi:hypothetical protein